MPVVRLRPATAPWWLASKPGSPVRVSEAPRCIGRRRAASPASRRRVAGSGFRTLRPSCQANRSVPFCVKGQVQRDVAFGQREVARGAVFGDARSLVQHCAVNRPRSGCAPCLPRRRSRFPRTAICGSAKRRSGTNLVCGCPVMTPSMPRFRRRGESQGIVVWPLHRFTYCCFLRA